MIQWLSFTLIAVLIQGFFALFEMACVSFNKVRLQYYVSRGDRRAVWLSYLLQRPSRLFGTTLIGINASLQIGSECARNFYESIHLNPDWAPVTQVLIVLIFGELAPMFAARRHPEQIAMTFIPFIALLARILSPITWAFDQISRCIHWMMGRSQETPLFLSREEVKMAFEERGGKEDEFNSQVSAIFQLKNLSAGQLMLPLKSVQLFSSQSTVKDVRTQLESRYTPIFPIYHRVEQNIVAVGSVRELIRLSEGQKVLDHAKSPWFVTKDTSVLELLDQFRRNNQSVAVILESSGKASGILTLDQIVDSIFGPEEAGEASDPDPIPRLQRTLQGSMTVAEFNHQFEADLEGDDSLTLSEFLSAELDHPPALGESLRVGPYEFTILDLSLRGIRVLSVHTVVE